MITDTMLAPIPSTEIETAPGPRFHGLPTHIALQDGRTAAVLNLAAARHGERDPWHAYGSPIPGVWVVASSTDAGVNVADLDLSDEDIAPALSALQFAVSARRDRHDELADGLRVAAGRSAARVTDVMARARLLDATDGWSGYLGDVVDRSTEAEDGVLYELPAEMAGNARALVVQCPSTGRRYVVRVPVAMTTAAAARRWTLGLGEGDGLVVET